MSGLLQISGIVGLILIFFGFAAYLFNGDPWDTYVLAHLGLGTLCLLAYLLTQGGELIRALGRRSTRHGLHSGLYSLLFLGVLIMVNFLSLRHHTRWDLTEEKVFTLSPQTAKVLEQLDRDLEIYGFFERGKDSAISDLMKRYMARTTRVKFHGIDPDRNPEMARRFHIQQLGTLHLRYAEESANIAETTEEAITNAIARITKGTKKTFYFLTGHGEPKIDDRESNQGYGSVKEALENDNFRVQELLLSAQERVPELTSLLIVAGPQKPLLEHELQAIEDYLKNGGRLLILLPPPGGASLTNFLLGWGVQTGEDIVVDQVVRLFAGPSLGVQPIAETYGPLHPITRDFKERTIFPMVRSVEPAASPADGLQITSLVKTSSSSWAEKDVDGIFKQGRASLGPQDKKGPVSIGVAVTADLKTMGIDRGGKAQIAVFGTAEFANNRFIDVYFNRDLFLNTINWLVGEEEFISIRPRSIRSSRIQLTEKEGNLAFYLSFLILPEIVLITGLAVWWRRR